MLTRANISWTGKQLTGMVNKGRFNFGHDAQRPAVWKKDRKSLLIHSMIEGYPIPPVFVTKKDDGSGKRGGNIYTPLDGIQRLTAISGFINDEYDLVGIPSITYESFEEDGTITVNINGQKFSELPSEIQDAIKDYTLSVTYFEELTYEEEIEVFKRLNNGQQLTSAQRNIASCKELHKLMEIGKHELFMGNEEEKGMLSPLAIKSKKQCVLAMKALVMATENPMEVNFESKNFNAKLENTDITAEQMTMLDNIFSLMVDCHDVLVNGWGDKKVAKKLYTETHFVNAVPFFKRGLELGFDGDLMAEWFANFFRNDDGKTSTNDRYNEHCTGGNAKQANISARHEELEKAFNVYAERRIG